MPILKDFLTSTVKFVLIAIAFVVLLVLNWRIWNKDIQQEQTIMGLQQQLIIQQKENMTMAETNAELRTRIDSLKRGSVEMIEEEARDNFGMVGEGETFYDFDPKSSP
ncbi:MAG: cell division protein FtsB [Gammaproteobacteria bacterium]|nr:MAG: cell division protein FtsB [Gammaproteobacteria bacterium]